MMVYAGFAGAERKNGEIVSRPCSIVADDEKHAQRILITRAKEIWPETKGWKGHCAYIRLVPVEQMNLDERVVPKFMAEDMEALRDFFED
jgi:hypothetical protein